MPRINRIRIINFSYNNDRRHILDETFNLHGGDNVLLNLANGGGKSVLVQLLMQPIAPEVKIQGRSITGFFRRRKLPAYVLLEWKLDSGGGYLMTGIGIVSADVSGVEEEKSRIKYFTFTSGYSAANGYDLGHIELVNRVGNELKIKPFKEAREMMAERARKDAYNFGYYTEDDQDKYRKRLAEFGIAQDEWKNIIAKINDSEGGLEEIFQKYKNSSQLLNEWVIKTIEKVKYKNRAEARQLEEMLENLVREVAENERFIVEKEQLEGFLSEFGAQVESIDGLLKGLEEKQRCAAKLAALHGLLSSEHALLDEQYAANHLDIESCAREKLGIDLEERSHRYLQSLSEHQNAAEVLAQAEKKRGETESELEDTKHTGKVMQAAGLNEEIGRKKAEIAGIEERLAAAEAEYDTDQRMHSMEYSLQLLCQKKLQRLTSEYEGLLASKGKKESELEKLTADLHSKDAELGENRYEKGQLKERKKSHESYAREMADLLKITLNRNLLGEIPAADLERLGRDLNDKQDSQQAQAQRVEAGIAGAENRGQEIDAELKALQAEHNQENIRLEALKGEIASYDAKEREVKAILHKYGFAAELRFEQAKLEQEFKRLLQHLKQRVDETARLRDELKESLSALHSGRFHAPQELLSLLDGLDISYDTGEGYLRNQEPEIRQQLLLDNPVLPYALIIPEEHLSALSQAMSQMALRKIVPIISYQAVGAVLECKDRMVRSKDGFELVCLYEGRVFDNDSLAKLEAELQQKSAEAIEKHEHYVSEYNAAVQNKAICLHFDYTADYRYTRGKQQGVLEERLQELKENISRLESEKIELRRTQRELEAKLKELEELLRTALANLKHFGEFLQREQAYQVYLGEWNAVIQAIEALERELKEFAAVREKLGNEINELTYDCKQKEIELKEIREKFSLYEHAQKAEIIPGNIAELEEQLKALRDKAGGEIAGLTEQKRVLLRESAKKETELKKLGLSEAEYAGVAFDEGKLDRNKENVERLERLLGELRQTELSAARKESSDKTSCEIALDEVKKLGAEYPLGPEEIKGNFAGRRKSIVQRQTDLGRENKQIEDRQKKLSARLEKICQKISPAEVEPEKGFQPEADILAQTERIVLEYREIDDGTRNKAGQTRNNYNRIRGDYQDKNPNIQNIFKGLDLMWGQAVLEYEHYYYIYERMCQHREKLQELIKLHESQLANLERDKKDLIQQSLLQGMGIYEEILRISNNSKVTLQGKVRPVQMLKIEVQLDSHDTAGERMKEHIEQSIQTVREETRLQKREDEVRKTIAKLMSSRELLNVFLGTAHIPVKVFKIDLNMQNSALKTWEDAVRENSGGEKFVVFFSLLSALMSYTRTRTLEAVGADADKDNDSSVLVMDNPFGPISSEHLLNPLFEIAKKHRTQLICLSDLKQNSILNCFNLIYMLKIRSSSIGNNEYLKFEEIIRDASIVEHDEKLEKAFFRVSESRQISLFA